MVRILRRLSRARSVDSRTRLVAAPEVRASARADGIVFLHAGSGEIYSANTAGARIWERLREGATPEAAGAALAREFGVADGLAVRDAVRFADELLARGILVRGRAA